MSASNDRMKTPWGKKQELPVPEWAQMVKDDEPTRRAAAHCGHKAAFSRLS
jgi:hypothetical protein